MARKYGKLRDNSGLVDTSDQMPHLSVPGTEIVEVEQEKWSSIILGWVKGSLVFVISMIALAAILITGMACTLMVFSPLGEGTDRTLVIRGAWADTAGKPPVGTEVAISHNNFAPTDQWWDWIAIGWTGIPSPSRVEIVSTGYDKLYINGTVDHSEEDPSYTANVAIVDNPKVSGEFVQSPVVNFKKFKDDDTFEFNHTLDDEYLVKCVSGSCDKGTYFVIDKEQIYGEVR